MKNSDSTDDSSEIIPQTGCGCIYLILLILILTAWWVGLPTSWGKLNID